MLFRSLLSSGSPLLPEFLDHVLSGLEKTVQGLTHTGGADLELYQGILNDISEWRKEYAHRP